MAGSLSYPLAQSAAGRIPGHNRSRPGFISIVTKATGSLLAFRDGDLHLGGSARGAQKPKCCRPGRSGIRMDSGTAGGAWDWSRYWELKIANCQFSIFNLQSGNEGKDRSWCIRTLPSQRDEPAAER